MYWWVASKKYKISRKNLNFWVWHLGNGFRISYRLIPNNPLLKYCSKNPLMEGLQIGPETIRWWKTVVWKDGGCRTFVLPENQQTHKSRHTMKIGCWFQKPETIFLWKNIISDSCALISSGEIGPSGTWCMTPHRKVGKIYMVGQFLVQQNNVGQNYGKKRTLSKRRTQELVCIAARVLANQSVRVCE